MHTVTNPILTYTPYVPYQSDIENNITEKIKQDLRYEFQEEMQNALDELYSKKMKNWQEQFEKIKKEFYETIKFRLCDSVIGIILFVIIYVKVFTGSLN